MEAADIGHGRQGIQVDLFVHVRLDKILQPVLHARVQRDIVPSTESPGGMDELGTALIAPALANAVFAATGKRLRTLPLEPGPV